MSYDVVIVGGSIAGCTAAILYARAGLGVALVEKHRSAATFKALCGHFILAGAQPTLRRAGLWEAMVREGAAVGPVASWSEAGWMAPDAGTLACINLRWSGSSRRCRTARTCPARSGSRRSSA
jgi:2-polyprenyl-6-methoxyphenol hydroxylase-like FAD-dependent oxidoreductase